jgi:aspartate carbamoyltransferase regulatory subunit
MTQVIDKVVDLQRAKEDYRYRDDYTQEKLVKVILAHDYDRPNDERGPWGNLITLAQIAELGVKRPHVLVNQLIKKGVLQEISMTIGESLTRGFFKLQDKQVICKNCYMERELSYREEETGRIERVFLWEREEHLRSYHHWRDDTFELEHYKNWKEGEFTESFPNKRHDHEYEFVSLEADRITVKCKLCNAEHHEYIENRGKRCLAGVFA